jgi:hypothetical protein
MELNVLRGRVAHQSCAKHETAVHKDSFCLETMDGEREKLDRMTSPSHLHLGIPSDLAPLGIPTDVLL